VYASPSYCSQVAPLRTGRNTRYGWVANPYPTGTLTRQDTPSLLGAITMEVSRAGRCLSNKNNECSTASAELTC
jgi:hypothetical protein